MATRVVATGEPDASDRLRGLFDAHHARLYRLARRLSRTQDDALDLVQETFLRAAGAVGRVPAGTAAEEAWLVRVLVNLSRDAGRRSRVRAEHAARAPHEDATSDPEDAHLASAIVWSAVARLSPRRRAVVVLHELEGVPVRRVASMLGISAVTVRWHLLQARRELTQALRGQGGTR